MKCYVFGTSQSDINNFGPRSFSQLKHFTGAYGGIAHNTFFLHVAYSQIQENKNLVLKLQIHYCGYSVTEQCLCM